MLKSKYKAVFMTLSIIPPTLLRHLKTIRSHTSPVLLGKGEDEKHKRIGLSLHG